MTTVALFGAGGKMGYRLASNFRAASTRCATWKVSEAGRERLKAGLGFDTVSAEDALRGADVVVVDRLHAAEAIAGRSTVHRAW